MKNKNKIQNNILVKIIGINCVFQNCQESSKFHYKDSQLLDDGTYKEFDVYLCEKHFNKIKNNTNKQFKIIINEQMVSNYKLVEQNGELSLGNRFLPTIMTKPKVNRNWRGTNPKESKEYIQLQLAKREIELMGNKEQLQAFYKQNKHQFETIKPIE